MVSWDCGKNSSSRQDRGNYGTLDGSGAIPGPWLQRGSKYECPYPTQAVLKSPTVGPKATYSTVQKGAQQSALFGVLNMAISGDPANHTLVSGRLRTNARWTLVPEMAA